jgi:hypothetical protein
MTPPGPHRALLDAALADPTTGIDRLRALSPGELDTALQELVRERGEAALPLVAALVEHGHGEARRVARRVRYRLAQAGLTVPRPEGRPVLGRRPVRPLRAWMSGLDGSGSRAAWILFEGPWAGLLLCSVIINDVEGILEAAGGEITKKRFETELARLRASQKLPWVEVPPAHAIARVADARAIHAARGSSPPADFGRWEPLFARPEGGGAPAGAPAPAWDPSLAQRAAQLFDLPELAGWFLDPERVQGDALQLMEARASQLIVADHVKAEREAAIVATVVERELSDEMRRRWASRLGEMALIFDLTGRPDATALARAAAGQLADAGCPAPQIAFARGLAWRALEVAAEVAAGRVSASEVSRQPRDRER